MLVFTLLICSTPVARAEAAMLERGAKFAAQVLSYEVESRQFAAGESEYPAGPPALASLRTDKIELRLDGSEAQRRVTISTPDGANLSYSEQLRGCEGTRSTINRSGIQRVEPLDGASVRAFNRELSMFPAWLMARLSQHAFTSKPAAKLRFDGHMLDAITVMTADGPLQVGFDSESGLPVVVRRQVVHPLLGKRTYEIHYTAWRSVGVLRVPKSWTVSVAGQAIEYASVRDASVSKPRSEMETPPCATPPRGDESDITRLLMDRSSLLVGNPDWQLVPVAEGIHRMSGPPGDIVVVEMRDHLVLFDAPCAGRCAASAISTLRSSFPNKPIRTLVLSHHHDARAYGLVDLAPHVKQIVVAGSARAWTEKLLRRVPAKKRPIVLDVAPSRALTDGVRQIRLVRLSDHPHASTLIIAYIPDAKVLWSVDTAIARDHPLHFDWNDKLARAQAAIGVQNSAIVVDGRGSVLQHKAIAVR